VALRYEKAWEEGEPEETEQYQLFATSQHQYRVFVTDLSEPLSFVVWFCNQRGGAENLIKEATTMPG
jgi:hemolysin-activating ACP:hemolysin acyltransferase